MTIKKLTNNYQDNPNYLKKSDINRKTLRDMCIPDSISVDEVKNNFDDLLGEIELTGNPYNEKQRRHTKYVSRYELYNCTIKGRYCQHKQDI